MLWVFLGSVSSKEYQQHMLSLRNKNKIISGYPSNLGYLCIGLDNNKFECKNVIFFLYILGAQKNRLIETYVLVEK